MSFEDIKKLDDTYVMHTYGRYNVAIDHGKGAICYDPAGKSYIDFTSGIGVNSLGFADEGWVAAVTAQLNKLQHISNLYYTEPCVLAAKRICEKSGMKKVFFGNSGAEANEGVIKAARKYSFQKYGEGRSKIVALENSFHGRTMAALSATGQNVYHNFFFPFVDGFVFAKANDTEDTLSKLTDDVCAVMMELVQGEGGVMPLMAKAAAQSGAVGIRANTVRDITQIKEAVDLPVIGIIKKDYEGTPMYITVTMKEVDELVACGVDILAVQGTSALRPDGSTAPQFIAAIKEKYPDQLVMADCATLEEGIACAGAGADFVGTTMRGYTPETKGIDDIDFDFIHELSEKCPAKIIAEGHIHYPEQAKKALEAGAFALVVGGAITRPAEITARFVSAIQK